MSFLIEDEAVVGLVRTLATRRGVSLQDAVSQAVSAELERQSTAASLCDRLAALRAAHPLPPPAGALADKAFFDELSGEP